jgi:hypothetical protein
MKSRTEAEVPVLAALADEEDFPLRGTIDFSENRLDPNTGTLQVRAVIPNPKPYVLSPGMFLRIRLPIGQPREALMVAEQAVGTDQGRKFLYVVNDKDEVVYRPVKVGALSDGRRVIEEGLGPDDRVVVSGLQRIRPGVKVVPRPAEPVAAGAGADAGQGPGPAPRRARDGRLRRAIAQGSSHRDAPPPRPSPGGGAGKKLPLPPERVGVRALCSAAEIGSTEFDLALLHRPADLRVGPVDRHHAGRRHRAVQPAAGAVSADRPAHVQVDCKYPGASAQVVAETVAAPIEQQVNGVEGMLYMSSQCTNDGSYNLDGHVPARHDLNLAQVLVQNRVALALPLLPDVIKQAGVTARKRSPDILLSIAINSPEGLYDQLYLSNYAALHVKDELARPARHQRRDHAGPAGLQHAGLGDPEKRSPRGHDGRGRRPGLREQNQQVAAGQIGQPRARGQAIQMTSRPGPPERAEQFERSSSRPPGGPVVRRRTSARVAVGPEPGRQPGQRLPSASMAIFPCPRRQRPGTARPSVKARSTSVRRTSRGASSTRSATTPRRSSARRSTRCSRRSRDAASSWWRSSCCCSSRIGARRSSR